ncbi:hypothetical protein POG22_08110 [Geitlerinema sp. CS-897]|nr:hypothetical protein [Geitlerinema sp. CS-897]
MGKSARLGDRQGRFVWGGDCHNSTISLAASQQKRPSQVLMALLGKLLPKCYWGDR